MRETSRKHVSTGQTKPSPAQTDGRSFFLLIGIGFIACLLLYGAQYTKAQSGEPVPLPSGLNPNTASLGSLIRLEGIGPVRAYDVIKYRENRLHSSEPAFRSAQDLEIIKGIGPKTVEKLKPWLVFDNE